MSFFKKIAELFDKPQTTESSGEWFYHTKTFSRKIIIFYNKIIDDLGKNSVLKTGETISVNNLAFNETTASVIKKWGNPRCSFKNMKGANIIHIFFYRRDFVYENTLFQLQFYNNELFFVSIEVGKNLMQAESKISMLSKFLPNFITKGYTQVEDIPVWTDTENNYLTIQDDVSLNICYLNGKFANAVDLIQLQEIVNSNNSN